MTPEHIIVGALSPQDVQADTQRLDAIAFPRALGTLEFEPIELPPAVALQMENVVQIVHDFKNPLATISLEAWLLGDKGAVTQDEIRSAVARIQHNVMFLDRMVHDLLDSAALDDGHFELHRADTELRTLLESVIERVVPSRDRDRVFLEAEGRLFMSIDPLRIERVVANLLSNALKYGSRSTGVVLRLDARPAGSMCVSVIDAGPGLTAAEIGYVFERYRRTPSARGCEGSGLGLYASKRIIEAHGGMIGVESIQGVGSRFYFELPARELTTT